MIVGDAALRGRNTLPPQKLVVAGATIPKPRSHVDIDPTLFLRYFGSHIREAIVEGSAKAIELLAMLSLVNFFTVMPPKV